MSELQPIATCPKDGSYFVAWGPSGHMGTPLRCAVCRWDEQYRPRNPLVNHSSDAFTDGGEEAIYWSPLPFDPAITMNRLKIDQLQFEINERKAMIAQLSGEVK
jgi:hypothetical protein